MKTIASTLNWDPRAPRWPTHQSNFSELFVVHRVSMSPILPILWRNRKPWQTFCGGSDKRLGTAINRVFSVNRWWTCVRRKCTLAETTRLFLYCGKWIQREVLISIIQKQLYFTNSTNTHFSDNSFDEAIFISMRWHIRDSIPIFAPKNDFPKSLQFLCERIFLKIVNNSNKNKSWTLDNTWSIRCLCKSRFST